MCFVVCAAAFAAPSFKGTQEGNLNGVIKGHVDLQNATSHVFSGPIKTNTDRGLLLKDLNCSCQSAKLF